MNYPVFYVPAGDVLPVMFSSYAGSTGASITLTGLAVSDIEIYRDGSVTQRASDAGYALLDTDGIDFDSITGIHGFSIDTGDNTDAGFYTVGAWFTVVVSAVTVDSQTVNFIACQFRLMPAESVAGKPKVDVDAFGGTAGTFASGRPEVSTLESDRAAVRGTATTGGTTTSIPTSSLSPAAAVADQFKGRIVIFDKATATTNLRGQATDITASTIGGTLTVTALTTAPASGDTFTIV